MNATWAHGSLLPMLQAVEPVLPPALVTRAATRRLCGLAADLPFVPIMGLECRLASTRHDVDLLLSDPGQLPLEVLLQETPLGCSLRQRDSTFPLSQWVDMTLLEFDVTADDHVPPPAVFLSLKPGPVLDGDVLVHLAATLVGRVPETHSDLLRRFAAAAGPDVQITHLGVMASRPEQALRVNVGAVAPDALLDVANTIGMSPDQRTAAASLLQLVAPFVHHVVLALDLADRVLPRFGVECYLAAPPESGDFWNLFLARLVAEGLCCPDEADAALAWPGRTRPSADQWPIQRQRINRFLGPAYSGIVVRTLNHVKLVATPGHPVEAKLYLLARHLWLDDDA